jgi:hypothetical protein
MSRNNEVTLRYEELRGETELAWGLIINGVLQWFPKSRCSINLLDNEIIVPQWLMSRKGIVKNANRFSWLA